MKRRKGKRDKKLHTRMFMIHFTSAPFISLSMCACTVVTIYQIDFCNYKIISIKMDGIEEEHHMCGYSFVLIFLRVIFYD